jgi:hypothetical protein
MKTLKMLSCIALAHVAATASQALPPTSVGDSFVSLGEERMGLGFTSLYYLGNDGTCKELSHGLLDGAGAAPIYQPSQSGTYTYFPTPGNPNEATLTIVVDGASDAFVLEFSGDTWGYINFAFGDDPFSFMLASPNTFLSNVSNRVTLRPPDLAVTGFVVQGTAPRLVMIRTVGPTLGQFGVSPVAANPVMNLFSGIGTDKIASAHPWGSVTGFDAQAMGWIFGIAGAFPLQSGSNDVVFFGELSPGVYTAQTSDATTSATGASALTEVYILPYSGSPPYVGFFLPSSG